MVHTYSRSAEEAGTRRTLESFWPASLADLVSFGLRERLCLETCGLEGGSADRGTCWASMRT